MLGQDYNVQAEKSAANLTMPINNVISGEEKAIYDSPDGLFAYISSDNNIWLKDMTNFMWEMEDMRFIINENIGNKPRKVKNIDNAFSVISSYFAGELILKKDGSVWYNSKKIFDNAIMIDMSLSGSIFILKEDNSLWAYGNNYKFNKKIYRCTNKPQKIMDNIKYVQYTKSHCDNREKYYLITIKNDGTLFQSKVETSYNKESGETELVKIGKEYKIADNVVAADIRNKYGLAVKERGELFYWRCEDVENNKNFSIYRITDNVKYAKLNLIGITAYILKNDNSLWFCEEFNLLDIYKNETPLSEDKISEYYQKTQPFKNEKKLYDNVYAIIGDKQIFIMDQEGNLIDAPYYCEDWNVKKPEYN